MLGEYNLVQIHNLSVLNFVLLNKTLSKTMPGNEGRYHSIQLIFLQYHYWQIKDGNTDSTIKFPCNSLVMIKHFHPLFLILHHFPNSLRTILYLLFVPSMIKPFHLLTLFSVSVSITHDSFNYSYFSITIYI